MSLTLHNTLTKKDEVFTPISDKRVALYTCGPTVYNYLHVGNWAAYIYWDILVRTLIANGYNVERVMNVTDVGHLVSDEDEGEDKLEKGARREGKTAWEIADVYTADFMDGMKKLNLLPPEHITRATEYIPQQLDLVRTLKGKGYTYQIEDGIYFDTSKFPTYADFAGLDLAAQRAGARVEFNVEKRSPSDFALWKFTPAGEKRDMEWETPSDLLESPDKKMGFPGWHLECSAMAMDLLGDTIDIHTGGIDHIPVHHTNEIAQSESASGKQFAHYWVHNNHLKSDGTKISKSLGNTYTLQELADKGFNPLDFRMFVLQGQYSNEGNFTFDNLTAAKNRLHHWRNIAALRWQTYDTIEDDDEKQIILVAAKGAVLEALNDNLNTPAALRVIDEAFGHLDSKPLESIRQHGLNQLLETIDETLGLRLLETTPDIDDDIKQLIVTRQRARDEKSWAESDKIRDQIEEKGVTIRDTPHGTIWEYAA
jgi:cysteinyl-tRNA synthetase